MLKNIKTFALVIHITIYQANRNNYTIDSNKQYLNNRIFSTIGR